MIADIVPPVKHTRLSRLAAASFVSAAVLLVSGCYQGISGTVNQQKPTGNGADVMAKNKVLVQDATLVIAPKTTGPGSLTFTALNNGTEPDKLSQIVTEPGSSVKLPDGGLELKPSQPVRVGWDSDRVVTVDGISTDPSSFVKVTFIFEKAGEVSAQVLTVPPTGYYAGVKGVTAIPEASAEASPEASESAEAHSGS